MGGKICGCPPGIKWDVHKDAGSEGLGDVEGKIPISATAATTRPNSSAKRSEANFVDDGVMKEDGVSGTRVSSL